MEGGDECRSAVPFVMNCSHSASSGLSKQFLLVISCLVFAAPSQSGKAEESRPALERGALTRAKLTVRFAEGLRLLNARYWSPTLNIWLDRPGDDLRAHFERRLNPPWWPSANAVEMLIDFMHSTGTAEYDTTIERLYDLQKNRITRMERVVAELKRRKQWSESDQARWQRRQDQAVTRREGGEAEEYYTDFQNEYLDDSGWWGITWLKMYDRTKAPRYLATARTIHAHMAKNWNAEKGGGVMWSEDADKQRPNAITNNLFLILSARLHHRTQEKTYLEWAEKTLRWFDDQKLYDGTAVVDAPGHKDDHWSYNQGTYLGGLAALFEATSKAEYLERAARVTEGLLESSGLLTKDGVIVEKLGTNGDASLFKGVFARYLAQVGRLLRASERHAATAEKIERVLQASLVSMTQHGMGPDGMFVADWHRDGKDRTTNFNTHVSGLLLIAACLENAR